MQLYRVPNDSKIRLADSPAIPPSHRTLIVGEVLHYYRTDGMYSLCHDQDDQWVHPSAWAEVEIVDE